MSQVFYRSPKTSYPVAVRGDGVYLYDEKGKAYLDASGGAAVSCLGHQHPYVIDAIKSQLDQLSFAHTAFFTNAPQEALAERLSARFPEKNSRVYFLSGGSEANETAIKLARQFWVAGGKPDKYLIISREQSYHGNTLGALSLSGNPQRRKVYQPMLFDWPRIEPCYAYRHQFSTETEQDYGERAANYLQQEIDRVGAENVAAFIAEPVVGATLGVVPAAKGYFERIREICNKNNILLILDEVMCGAGRTGHYFAFEADNIVPDIVTLAKGLGGGYQPIGAVICRDHIHNQIVDGSGSFAHGHTYIGHATACAAGLAVMDVIEAEHLLQKVKTSGEVIRTDLAAAFGEHPFIGDIRGRGLFIGIELVQDKADKTPHANGGKVATSIKQRAMSEGLICYPGSGGADGINGCHILLAPPFIYTSSHIDELVTKLKRVLHVTHF
ncbi:aspartate aminotransferase family protein [Alkalimonas sp. MEB108]|uniref:Aspartate aminotransferase family protein n=2 Tax=Alkalimonas cellulosilytica TaxID=3058395 RepID=A0ABU7J8L8_9GAMM|nr:aspartate aminotransferase family protein [Alkalimonas sp. MEB108]